MYKDRLSIEYENACLEVKKLKIVWLKDFPMNEL